MGGRIVWCIAQHEWRAFLRRNLAGVVTGMVPMIAAPFLGFISGSVVDTLVELATLGAPSSPEFVFPLFLVGLNLFPVLYTVFLASDSVVLEKELGTIELLLWTPVREFELLAGKAVVPVFYNLAVGSLNCIIFSGAYAIADSAIETEMPYPWLSLTLTYLLLVGSVLSAAMLGILVSAVASNAKASATIALSAGSVLVLGQVIVGAFLFSIGFVLINTLLGLLVLTLFLSVICGLAVIARFGNRECYFLEKRQEDRHAARD